MSLLTDLKTVDPNNPGAWPRTVQLFMLGAVLLGTLLLGAILDWQGEWDMLSSAHDQEEVLKQSFMDKKRQAINLDLIKKQLTETQQSFGALLRQLPNKSEMDALLTDINQAGLGRGLQFELFRPGAETMNGVFAEQPITIRVTGSYDDIGRFTSDVSQLSRIVTLNDISITTGSNGQLVMDATAKTYRYLDDEELAAQRRAARAGGNK